MARALLLSPHWERYHLLTRPRVPHYGRCPRAKPEHVQQPWPTDLVERSSFLTPSSAHATSIASATVRAENSLGSLFGQLLVKDWCCRASGASSFDSGYREAGFVPTAARAA